MRIEGHMMPTEPARKAVKILDVFEARLRVVSPSARRLSWSFRRCLRHLLPGARLRHCLVCRHRARVRAEQHIGLAHSHPRRANRTGQDRATPEGRGRKAAGLALPSLRQEKIDPHRIPFGLVGVMFRTLKEHMTWQT